MTIQRLSFHDIFSSSEDLPLANELKYVCANDDDCLPFDEIIAKAKPEEIPPFEMLPGEEYFIESRPRVN